MGTKAMRKNIFLMDHFRGLLTFSAAIVSVSRVKVQKTAPFRPGPSGRICDT